MVYLVLQVIEGAFTGIIIAYAHALLALSHNTPWIFPTHFKPAELKATVG